MKGRNQWQGVVLSVQPRIRLSRSFDQRSHCCLGYVLRLRSTAGMATREFVVGITEEAQEEHQIRVGDVVASQERPVADPWPEMPELFEANELEVSGERGEPAEKPPPFLGVPPALEVYEERGYRRLDPRTYAGTCTACLWGCKMAVEMIIDQWNPSKRRYRTETFCFGPKSCPRYKAGPTRKVPGRKGMRWEEDDWVDEDATAHRDPDE